LEETVELQRFEMLSPLPKPRNISMSENKISPQLLRRIIGLE
jgi:hypothetical protein